MSLRRFIRLPHLKIHNANALSSPFTIGFPAMTAWLGFTHALERKLQTQGYESLVLLSVGVISHRCDLQTYQGEGDFVRSIIGTANPVDKDGSRPAFIEEARCHLDVSLLIEYEADESELDKLSQTTFMTQLSQQLSQMKLAGGDLLDFKPPTLVDVDEEDEQQKRRLLTSFMPGYALIERRELMAEAMAQGADALDALLDHLTVYHDSEQDDDNQVTWHSFRKAPGWIVPIATGFHGISPLGEAKNQRDPDVPHCFAESLVTLGEFVMAHRIKQLSDFLWEYEFDSEKNLYLCQNIQNY